VAVVAVALGLWFFLRSTGPKQPAREHLRPVEEPHGEKHHSHKAYHNGCLNAIGSCEVGHLEARLTGDKLEVWFVGGGSDTGKSVRVKAKSIDLEISLPSGEKRVLRLLPSPLELAGETIGDCSHFEAKAEWLNGLESFDARGKVTFKGRQREIIIHYPEGYDPGHGRCGLQNKGG